MRGSDEQATCDHCGQTFQAISGTVDHETGEHFCAGCTVRRHREQQAEQEQEP